VANINTLIRDLLSGRTVSGQTELDTLLIELDGSANKSRLGANAILAVSIAFARAHAKESGCALYRHFANLLGVAPETMPRLAINLFSGGKHAGGQVSIQDVLLVPIRAATINKTLEIARHLYDFAADLILSRYGMRALVADEGGLAPPCRTAEEMVALALEVVERTGFRPQEDVALAIDVASAHFYDGQHYRLNGEFLRGPAMIERLEKWALDYPVISIEDGLAEDDWEHWQWLCRKLGASVLILGDDLLCTNVDRIRKAIKTNACNALLLKVNQVGTLTEAAAACRLARSAGWSVTVSVRSGETEDNWAADLAVGWKADYFKNGSITRSERLAKYNRLLEIEEETGWPVSRVRGPIRGSEGTSHVPTSL
jgi:enolase